MHIGATTAVIFDFDGVLADSEGLHLRAFQDVFEPRGWSLGEGEYFARYLGFDDLGLVNAYAADHGVRLDRAEARALIDQKSAAFRRRTAAGLPLYSGAAECVRRLAAQFPLAIASGSLRAEIEDALRETGLRQSFGAIVGADDVTATKPDPEPYLEAAARLGIAAARCVAIEDSHWGLTAARRAGMRTVAITTTSEAGALAGADRIVGRIGEVTPAMIEELAGLDSDVIR